MNIKGLSAEFPRGAVHWRAQTLTRNGDRALALAYLDARDVMDRLDEVCGPENWQSEFVETPKGRVICRIGIKIGDEWVYKSDGAGDTAVEGDKGGISDALKRAAVHWGIGRYLYALDAVWAPCETYEKNGKTYWSRWKGSPWDSVRGGSPKPPSTPDANGKASPEVIRDRIKKSLTGARTLEVLGEKWTAVQDDLKLLHPAMVSEITKIKDDRKSALYQAPDPSSDPNNNHSYQ